MILYTTTPKCHHCNENLVTSYTSSSSFCTNRSQCQRSLIWTKPLLKGPEADGVGRLPPPIIRVWVDWHLIRCCKENNYLFTYSPFFKMILHAKVYRNRVSHAWAFCQSLTWTKGLRTKRPHDDIITALSYQNDVETSFWRNNDVTIASRAPYWVQTTCTFITATGGCWRCYACDPRLLHSLNLVAVAVPARWVSDMSSDKAVTIATFGTSVVEFFAPLTCLGMPHSKRFTPKTF